MSDYNSPVKFSFSSLNKISSGPETKNDHLHKDKNQSYNDFKYELENSLGFLEGENSSSSLLEKASFSKDSLEDLRISAHANKRIKERQIEWNTDEFLKLKEAMQKLQNKGSKESLVITDKGAYIFDVKNKTVVTAMDKKSLTDNIFTKIDSTLFMS